MTKHLPTPQNDLEEAAQGQDLFRAPGEDLMLEQARDEAEASGWLPEDHALEWPSSSTTEKIVKRRRDLYSAMQWLESSAARASHSTDWGQDVSAALTNLHEALERHVAEVEGPDGLFAEVTDRAPHLAVALDDLRAEHRELTTATRDAIEALPDSRPEGLRRKLLAILGLLTVHRQNGAEVLFDAYNLDLSGGE